MPKRPRTQPWEYRLLTVGNPLEPDVELRANALGRQGWELVVIDAGVWIFKRPLTNESAAPSALEALVEETVPLAVAEPPTVIAPISPT